MPRNQPRRRPTLISATIVALLAFFATAGVVSAIAGQFDSLIVGRQGTGGVTYFNGSIVNTTTTNGQDNPVTFGDGVRIDGRIWRGATRGPGDPNPVLIDDDLTVEGDIRWDDGSSLTSAWLTQAGINTARAQNIDHIIDMLSCVGDFAEITTFIESEDYIFCWNLHIAGYSFPTGGPSGGPDESVTMENLLRQELTAEAQRK